MESKLKALKVAELRDILTKAQQPFPPKATKTDLIARILASKEATDSYFAPKDDLLAPPEDLDWDVDQNPPETPAEQPKPAAAAAKPPSETPAAKPASKTTAPAPAAVPAAVPPAATPPVTAPAPADDAELEKRKKRAERFGIPLVVESQPPPTKKKGGAPAAKAPVPDQQADEKLQARAQRFGNGQKRSAPLGEVDAEEEERRKKRAERFGTGPAKATA